MQFARNLAEAARPLARRVPGLRQLVRFVRSRYQERRIRGRSRSDVFSEIFRGNRWGSPDSASGTGSDLAQTAAVREALPSLLRELGATTLLDVPCGDFNWMQHVDLQAVAYVGGDIVGALIEENTARYARPGRSFRTLDLVADDIPVVDVILCRDCLVHLSFVDAIRALRNVHASGSRFLLTTTFVSRRANRDIPTGAWRPLNLERAPFNLPPPRRIIDERCTEGGGDFRDKALGLWAIEDLARLAGDAA